MKLKYGMSILILLCGISSIFSRTQSITVTGIPYSTSWIITKAKSLQLGRILIASSGSVAVDHDGQVFVNGTASYDNSASIAPAIFEVTFIPESIIVHDSLVNRTRSVVLSVSSDEKMSTFDESVNSFDFEDITKGRSEEIRDGYRVVTLTIGGIIYITKDTPSGNYAGTLTLTVSEE